MQLACHKPTPLLLTQHTTNSGVPTYQLHAIHMTNLPNLLIYQSNLSLDIHACIKSDVGLHPAHLPPWLVSSNIFSGHLEYVTTGILIRRLSTLEVAQNFTWRLYGLYSQPKMECCECCFIPQAAYPGAHTLWRQRSRVLCKWLRPVLSHSWVCSHSHFTPNCYFASQQHRSNCKGAMHQCASMQLCPCTIHNATMQLMPCDMLIVCTLASEMSRDLAGVSQQSPPCSTCMRSILVDRGWLTPRYIHNTSSKSQNRAEHSIREPIAGPRAEPVG